MSVKRKIVLIVLCVLTALTVAYIFSNSVLSGGTSSKESQGVYGAFKGIMDFVFGKDVITHGTFRKLAHGTEFTVLGIELNFIFITLKKYSYKVLPTVLFFGLFTAVTDEAIQILSDRGSLVSDVLIDFGGVVTATAIIYIVHILVKHIKENKRLKKDGEENDARKKNVFGRKNRIAERRQTAKKINCGKR